VQSWEDSERTPLRIEEVACVIWIGPGTAAALSLLCDQRILLVFIASVLSWEVAHMLLHHAYPPHIGSSSLRE
jgi:hypothetical protein